MAQRRMVSKRISKSAKFLTMPNDTQLLYFHMLTEADDDGIVEVYPLVRLLGTTADSIKVLLAKDFIRQINDDQVMLITDWNEHNSIRADRKTDSIYLDIAKELYPEMEFIESKERSDIKGTDGPRTVHGRRRVGQVRAGEVRLGEDSIEREATPAQEADIFFRSKEKQEEVISYLSKKFPESTVRNEVPKFISYWTELNKSGTKERWQLEKTFQVERRLATWFSQIKENKKTIQSL